VAQAGGMTLGAERLDVPVMRLEPIEEERVGADDPFYALGELAVAHGEGLTNEEIDEIVYQD
jgi:hypothetical protein